MITSKSKKTTHRRLKSTSPKKAKNRFYEINNKKRENMLAIEESKKLYTKLFSNPNNLLLNQLKNDHLRIFAGSFNAKDILVFSIIISKFYYFRIMELGTYDPNKGEEDELKRKKKEKYLYQNDKERKSKENEKVQSINKILASLGKNLEHSKKLTTLSLFSFNFDKKSSENITQGISRNKSLETLIIKKCKMNIDSYEILLKGLLVHEKIKYLDLSNNNFNDKYGNMISRIIIRQAQRRDQIIWSYGLRNEFPANNDYTKGLISINLHGNKLGEKSTDKICYALCNDQYLRSVDLSDNCIDNNSCKKYIYMMRKNNTLLTIDLRNNPGYDENIHSRLVMKMSKNIHFLYQQYQSGAYTEEEFENLKDFIEISFFDVDIPQEIVEFYNQNLPEEDDNDELGTDNMDHMNMNNINNLNHINNIIQQQEDFSNNEDEKDIIKISNNKSTNFSYNNILNKSKVSQADKSLIEENLKLKQQIIELKALNLQRHLKNNINDINNDNKNLNININKDSNRTIEGDYKRVVELINELNELMNNIESKKNKKDSKDVRKKMFQKNQKQEKEKIDNEQYLIEQERKEYEKLQELERQKEMEREKEEKIKKEKEKEEKIKKEKEKEEKLKKEKEKEEKLKKEKEEKLQKEKEEKIKKEKEEKLKKENEEKLKKELEEKTERENREKIEKEKEEKLKKEKEKEKEKEEKKKKEEEEKIKKEKEEAEKKAMKEEEKEKGEKEKEKDKDKEKKKKQKNYFDDEEDSNRPLPYQELQAEPSEDNNGSQLVDEDGNVFNFDDLTDEEKMSIIHQQLILQKLQEDAEARGEQFDPQEYLAYLEQQAEAEAEEEELMNKNSSNKLNKSF